MRSLSYRAWSPPDLVVVLLADLALLWWQYVSPVTAGITSHTAALVVLLAVLSVSDWHGLWTIRGRWPAGALVLIALLSSTGALLALLVYLVYAWRDHLLVATLARLQHDTPRLPGTITGLLAFHPRSANSSQDRCYYPLPVYDDVTLAWMKLAADGIPVHRQANGRWQVSWPPVVYAQCPQHHQQVTHLCFLLTPDAMSGYQIRITHARRHDCHVALEIFLRTDEEVPQWV